MIRAFEPPVEVVEEVGEMGFDGLIAGFGVLLAGVFQFLERPPTRHATRRPCPRSHRRKCLGTTPRRSSRGVVRAFRCALQSLCGTRRLWGWLAEALSIVVVELALAGGAEFLYHLFEFGDLFERARTEFELVCRISTFARREDSSFRRWFAADRRSRSSAFRGSRYWLLRRSNRLLRRVGGSRRGTRSPHLSRRRGAAPC